MIRFKKLGATKTLLTTIIVLMLIGLTYASLIAITRIPINKFIIPIGMAIYVITIIVLNMKYEKKLEENNEELSQLYEKLAASEEELRLQYSKVTEANEKLEEYSATLYYRSNHDALTGLYNRLYLSEEIEKHLYKGTEEGALYFIDLDNFKQVNDVYGHRVGDRVIMSVSNILREV